MAKGKSGYVVEYYGINLKTPKVENVWESNGKLYHENGASCVSGSDPIGEIKHVWGLIDIKRISSGTDESVRNTIIAKLEKKAAELKAKAEKDSAVSK